MKTNFFQNTKLTKRILTVQNKKQTTAYIYLLLTLLTASFFGFFALRPAFSIIANLQKQLADNKVVLEALETKLDAITNLDKEYKQIEPNLELIYEAIPATAQAAPLIRQIEKITQANNLSINNLDTGVIEEYPLEGNNKMYSFTFSINAEGTEANVQAFLEDLVTFNRVVGLNRVATDKSEESTMVVTVEGVVYFLPEVN